MKKHQIKRIKTRLLLLIGCLVFIMSYISCKEEVILIPTVYETKLYESEQLLNVVYFIDESRGFVVGDNGVFLYTIDGGQTWDKHEGYNVNFNSITFGSDSVGYISGNNGSNKTLLKTLDGGISWIELFVPNFNELDKISFATSDTGYALGDGEVFITTNGANTWSKTSFLYEAFDPDIIYFTTGKSGIICDFDDETFYTNDCGETWIHGYPFAYHINDIDFVNDSNGCLVDSHGDIFLTTNGGLNWTELYMSPFKQSEVYLETTYMVSPDCIYVAGLHTLGCTNNGGKTWTMYSNEKGLSIHYTDIDFPIIRNGFGIYENTIYRIARND